MYHCGRSGGLPRPLRRSLLARRGRRGTPLGNGTCAHCPTGDDHIIIGRRAGPLRGRPSRTGATDTRSRGGFRGRGRAPPRRRCRGGTATRTAYARFPRTVRRRYRDGWLPDAGGSVKHVGGTVAGLVMRYPHPSPWAGTHLTRAVFTGLRRLETSGPHVPPRPLPADPSRRPPSSPSTIALSGSSPTVNRSLPARAPSPRAGRRTGTGRTSCRAPARRA